MPKEKEDKEVKDELSGLPGVGPATAEKLKEAGFTDLVSIATTSPDELMEATELGEGQVAKIIAAARGSSNMGFIDGVAFEKSHADRFKITTGVKELDNLIGGGLESGTVLELFGEWGSSKTQVAHQFCVNVQMDKDKGGAGKGSKVAFLDTEGTFIPTRIKQMARAKGLDEAEALANIMVAKAYNTDHQIKLGDAIEKMIKVKKEPIKLIVVDSLMSLFRAEFVGRETLPERGGKINRHMKQLAKLADLFNLAVVVTNQVSSTPDVFYGDPTRAIGGHIVGHNSTFRIYLRKCKAGRIAKLVDSPYLPDGECVFGITDDGLIQAEQREKK